MLEIKRPAFLASLLLGVAMALPAQSAIVAAPATPKLSGTLRTRDHVEVLSLHGSVEERGFTEGYLTAERIRALFRDFALSPRVVPQPGLWNLVVVPRTRQRLDLPAWVRPWCDAVIAGIEARDPDLLEIPELNRDLDADDLVACATLPDFMGLACSSFVAWGDRIDGAGPMVGRNLDYLATAELLKQTMVIVNAPREGRAGWVSIGWPGIAGCLTGISEHGVSVAIHDVPAHAIAGSKVTPRPVALQELIETFVPAADPAAEGAEILRTFRYGMGGNVMVGWRGRDGGPGPGGAVYELWPAAELADGVTVRGPDSGRSFVTCSNHHRLRVEPEQKCWRYDALSDGVAGLDAPLDLARATATIRQAEVKGTLYQVVADLGRMEVALRLRRVPREDQWDVVGRWSVSELLREAAASEPVAVPVGK